MYAPTSKPWNASLLRLWLNIPSRQLNMLVLSAKSTCYKCYWLVFFTLHGLKQLLHQLLRRPFAVWKYNWNLDSSSTVLISASTLASGMLVNSALLFHSTFPGKFFLVSSVNGVVLHKSSIVSCHLQKRPYIFLGSWSWHLCYSLYLAIFQFNSSSSDSVSQVGAAFSGKSAFLEF